MEFMGVHKSSDVCGEYDKQNLFNIFDANDVT